MPNNEPHGINTPAMKGDASENVAPAAQRVVLYEEDLADPTGKQYLGSVIWRTEPVKATGSQKPDIAVRADIEIPDRKFKMTMSFRRSTDASSRQPHRATDLHPTAGFFRRRCQQRARYPDEIQRPGPRGINFSPSRRACPFLPTAMWSSTEMPSGVAMSMMAFVIWMSAYGGVGLPEG